MGAKLCIFRFSKATSLKAASLNETLALGQDVAGLSLEVRRAVFCNKTENRWCHCCAGYLRIPAVGCAEV